MRNLRILVLGAAVVLLVTSLAGTAIATTEECHAKIDALIVQTGEADFFGRFSDRDIARLQDKLEAASEKVDEGKIADAIAKVSDFAAAVDGLSSARKPKIDPDDAAALTMGAEEIITCLEALAVP